MPLLGLTTPFPFPPPSRLPNLRPTSATSNSVEFYYPQADPSIRWPDLHLHLPHLPSPPQLPVNNSSSHVPSSPKDSTSHETEAETETESLPENFESLESKSHRTHVKKMSKLALKRAKDWKGRVRLLCDRILSLPDPSLVSETLEHTEPSLQITPSDLSYIVRHVGQSSWRHALEAFDWLTLHRGHAPGPHLLSSILSVLGRARQDSLAEELFLTFYSNSDSEPALQVYNAMMGVYARTGQFGKAQNLLDSMRDEGLEPDLVSFNTLINARAKIGILNPGSALDFISEVRKSGLTPDTITYNTLLNACSHNSSLLKDAVKVFDEMLESKCEPDLWTYNAMISVYGRSAMDREAERLFHEISLKGFKPDSVSYNSLLHAFARNNDVSKVESICKDMIRSGFGRNEVTYNTMIYMYGKNGRLDIALDLYDNMRSDGCKPDVITYTTLVDLLGKSDRVSEAGKIMAQMIQDGLTPTVKTFNALICGYAKCGMRIKAEESFNYMIKSGIKPDKLVYLVILDVILRDHGEVKKVMGLYKSMVKDGFYPDEKFYRLLLELLVRENEGEMIQEVIQDLENVNDFNLVQICDILVRAKCYIQGAEMLKRVVLQGYEPNQEILSLILNEFEKMEKLEEQISLLEFIRKNLPDSDSLISESSIIMLCRNKEIDLALEEYNNIRFLGYKSISKDIILYEYLISSCEESGFLNQASQIHSDMSFLGIQPSEEIYKNLISIYCKLNYPETAEHLMHQSLLNNPSFSLIIIETYGKLKSWQKAEKFVEKLKSNEQSLDRKIWNGLINAYSLSGLYEKSRAVFNQMMKNGPFPSVDSVNGLINALIIDIRLDEMYVVIQELQDMGFKISKSTILLMLDAFARDGNIFEVKKIYNSMKAAGYLPNMHLYRGMIALLSQNRKVFDVELILEEMERNGFKLDLVIYNELIKMYTRSGEYKKTLEAYKGILNDGLKPDEETYNSLIVMYSRDLRPEEGLTLLKEMKKLGLDPKLDSYKSLLAACVKSQLLEQAEMIFDDIRSKNYKLDRLVYHLMLKMYRNLNDYAKSENLVNLMKKDGIEPTIATMHILMLSYNNSGQPKEAENILNNLKVSGLEANSLPYSTVIDAYLKNREYNIGIEKLMELKRQGIEIDHRIWTVFIRAASFCEKISEMFLLLDALKESGFDLPIRLLKEKHGAFVSEVEKLFEELQNFEDNAGFNFVNAILDLLWAFEKRATASWIFQLAIKKNIYRPNVFRVEEKDWGADFRKMSGGAALVALTLWLDNMQDAALQGLPESPKSVVLIMGGGEYNQVSLLKTLKAYLLEMGSPFLPCKIRSGLLISKAHSLKMWLKDSTFCMDLELKDGFTLPNENSMRLIEGYFMRAGLVPAFKEIEERLGEIRGKKFARLALLSEECRDKVITRDIEGSIEKMNKRREKGGFMRKKKSNGKYARRKHRA